MHSGSFIRAPDSLDRMRCWREADSGAFPQPGRGAGGHHSAQPPAASPEQEGSLGGPGVTRGGHNGERAPVLGTRQRRGWGTPRRLPCLDVSRAEARPCVMATGSTRGPAASGATCASCIQGGSMMASSGLDLMPYPHTAGRRPPGTARPAGRPSPGCWGCPFPTGRHCPGCCFSPQGLVYMVAGPPSMNHRDRSGTWHRALGPANLRAQITGSMQAQQVLLGRGRNPGPRTAGGRREHPPASLAAVPGARP